MGAEVHFFLQKRVIDKTIDKTKWEDVFLYTMNENGEPEVAHMWRGSEAYDMCKKYFHMLISKKEAMELSKKVNWWLDDNYDDDDLIYYAISLAKLHHLDYDLRAEINNYLTFADNDYVDEDNIRVIALVSC